MFEAPKNSELLIGKQIASVAACHHPSTSGCGRGGQLHLTFTDGSELAISAAEGRHLVAALGESDGSATSIPLP